MTTLTLNISNPSILPSLKKVLASLDGVTIVKDSKKRRTGMEIAREDVKKGRVLSYASKEELFKDLGL